MPEEPFSAYVVGPADTLEDALALIEANRHRTAIVVDSSGVVVGTLSDGDARKAILDHRLLSTPVEQVMNTNFVALSPASVAEAPTIFAAEHIFVIPVVGERGELVDLLSAYD